MIYTKSHLQTFREEYNDVMRHLFNIKSKIQHECRNKFEKLDINKTGYITMEEFFEHFLETNDDIKTRMARDTHGDTLLRLDEIITLLL